MPQDLTTLIVQSGSLGLLAYVVWWLLRKFNGKLDRLTTAVVSLEKAITRLAKVEGIPDES